MKRYLIPLIFIVLFLKADILPANTVAYETFKQGLELEQQYQIFQARDKFIEAIVLEPENEGYLAHYGWFLHYHGFAEEAVTIFSKLLPLAEDKKPVYAGLAWNLKRIGMFEESLEAYAKIYKITTSEQNIRTAFENIKWQMHYDNLAKIISLKTKTQNTSNLISLFNAYVDQNELDNAIKTAELLQSVNGLETRTRLQYARVLSWHGKKRLAETEYRKLIAGSPGSAFLLFEIGGILQDDGRLSESVKVLEKSLSIYPDASVTKKRLSEVLAQLGMSGKAINMASSIDQAAPFRLTGLLARARAFHFSGRLKDARTVYQTILDEYPYNSDALWGMTETSIYTGKQKSAKSAISKWQDTQPDQRLKEQKENLIIYNAPVLKLRAEHYTNSSDFTRNNFGSKLGFYAGTDFRLNADYIYSEFLQDGFRDITRSTILLKGEKHISERFILSGGIAGNFYKNNNNNLNADISLLYRHSNKLTSKVAYRHFDIIDTVSPFSNTIYSYVVTIGAVGLNIKSDDYKFYLQYDPASRVSMFGELIYGNYSDGNKKRTVLIEGGYKIFNTPSLRAVYDYFYLDFKYPSKIFSEGSKSESAYWDPINFESHTLRLDFHNNYNKYLLYGAEIGASYIPKSRGIATSLFLLASYRLTDRLSLRLDVRWFDQNKSIDRVGETGRFWANNYNILFKYRL